MPLAREFISKARQGKAKREINYKNTMIYLRCLQDRWVGQKQLILYTKMFGWLLNLKQVSFYNRIGAFFAGDKRRLDLNSNLTKSFWIIISELGNVPRYQYIQCKNNQVMKESEVPGNPVLKILDFMNVISSSINNNQNKAATHGQRKEKSRHCIP